MAQPRVWGCCALGFTLATAACGGDESKGGGSGAVGGGGAGFGGTSVSGGAGGSSATGGGGSGGATGGSAGVAGAAGCTPGGKQCSGTTPQTCDSNGKWTSAAACPYVCVAGACVGVCVPNAKQCKSDTPQTCDASGEWQDGATCPYGCDAGACKALSCKAGEFNCNGNEVQVCDPGPPAKWTSRSPALVCDPHFSQACQKASGSCVTLPKLSAPSAVGNCHIYATFVNTDGVFKGGQGVDAFGDQLYVEHGGLDVYQVTLNDTDGDGKLEPDQHPDNPLHTGPMEQRTLTFVTTYTPAGGNLPTTELHAKADRFFSLGDANSNPGKITEHVFATKTATVIASGGFAGYSYAAPLSLGFGDVDSLWYGGASAGVLSWHAPSSQWVMEFRPAIDGPIEVVVSPKTGQQYVYVAYDALGVPWLDQYRRDPSGWTPVNRLKFPHGLYGGVGRLGFGTFDHFWITNGFSVFEVGGGDCAQYLAK
ncbi:MAG: hypothetical protein IPM35_36060 [Myxococcales bacterium]|nr:hypothetical protein [Myxococcales bacterium]